MTFSDIRKTNGCVFVTVTGTIALRESESFGVKIRGRRYWFTESNFANLRKALGE